MSEPAASCARLPADALAALGRLRARDDVRVHVEGGHVWVYWPEADAELRRWLMALAGSALFVRGGGHWRRLNQHLPAFDVPDPKDARPLSGVLFPAPVEPTPPGDEARVPFRVTLVADDQPKPTTALRVSLAELARWAETATAHTMNHVLAARCEGAVLLRGRLPALVGERFWGKRVLVPAGRRPDPAVGEDALADALRLGDDDVALLTDAGADVFPRDAFGPVSRAAARLALEAEHAR